MGQCPYDQGAFGGHLVTELHEGHYTSSQGAPVSTIPVTDHELTDVATTCRKLADDEHKMACAVDSLGKDLTAKWSPAHRTAALTVVLGKMGLASEPVCNKKGSFATVSAGGKQHYISVAGQCSMSVK